VLEIHSVAIERFGGSTGVRDFHLLESAVAAPQASFGGKSPYVDVIEVAAAYLYYLCKNHPFVDGNKRAALGACLLCLKWNGVTLPGDDGQFAELTLAVASGSMDRIEGTARLRKLISESV